MFSITISTIQGYEYVLCHNGSSLLSCGIDNSQTNRSEQYRAAVPSNATTCRCFDWFGAACVAWCYNGLVSGFQISSVYSPGLSKAICPLGKYVIGCHVEPGNWHGNPYDKYRQYYPSSNTTCTCSDVYGTQCVVNLCVTHHQLRDHINHRRRSCPCCLFVCKLRVRLWSAAEQRQPVGSVPNNVCREHNDLPMLRCIRHNVLCHMRTTVIMQTMLSPWNDNSDMVIAYSKLVPTNTKIHTWIPYQRPSETHILCDRIRFQNSKPFSLFELSEQANIQHYPLKCLFPGHCLQHLIPLSWPSPALCYPSHCAIIQDAPNQIRWIKKLVYTSVEPQNRDDRRIK